MSGKPFIAVNNSGEGSGMERRRPEEVQPRREAQPGYRGEQPVESRTPITDAMRKVLAEIAIPARDGKPAKTVACVLAESIVERALGDGPQAIACIKLIMDRVEGPIEKEIEKIFGEDRARSRTQR
jgi:hypothetical protein